MITPTEYSPAEFMAQLGNASASIPPYIGVSLMAALVLSMIFLGIWKGIAFFQMLASERGGDFERTHDYDARMDNLSDADFDVMMASESKAFDDAIAEGWTTGEAMSIASAGTDAWLDESSKRGNA